MRSDSEDVALIAKRRSITGTATGSVTNLVSVSKAKKLLQILSRSTHDFKVKDVFLLPKKS